jgi:protein gp37
MATQGNMYSDITGTWNPLAGECSHKCGYCSTKTLKRYPGCLNKYSGPVRIDEIAMKKNLGSGKTWFVVAQNDLFAENVPGYIILNILAKCREYQGNTYLFQSKNPRRFSEYLECMPKSVIFCTTIESNRWYSEHIGNTPHPISRAIAIGNLIDYKRYVTIEPIMDFNMEQLLDIIYISKPHQVNIGADSKRHNLSEPLKENVLQLIEELEQFTTVKQKTNLARLLK